MWLSSTVWCSTFIKFYIHQILHIINIQDEIYLDPYKILNIKKTTINSYCNNEDNNELLLSSTLVGNDRREGGSVWVLSRGADMRRVIERKVTERRGA